MNENKIIETLKYISQFVENRHDEGLGDYLHIVIGRTDINVIDETIYLLERKQKEIVRYKKKIEEYKKIRNMLEETQMKLFEERKEVEKYKRYFKLAISDLQSEGYMQMPYKNIEKYYSKREDIV